MRCCDLTSGKMRTRGQLQRLTRTADGGGGFTATFTTYATVYLWFKSMSGSERIYAERLDAITRNRAYTRYRNDVIESDRLVVDGKAYQIRAAINMELRNQWLELDLDGGVAT